jgi:hypothetical protein
MALFDSVTAIPKVNDPLAGGLANYTTAGTQTLLTESVDKLKSTGKLSDNSKIIENAPTVASLQAASGSFDPALLTVKNSLSGSIKTSSISASQARAQAGGSQAIDDSHIVTLTSNVANDQQVVKFFATPGVTEDVSVSYDEIKPLQAPGAFQKYTGTSARSWQFNGVFFSRTSAEVDENISLLNILRSWVMPFYGTGTAADAGYADMLGAPPPVITLTGYRGLIGPVTVVIKSINWTFEKEVDYIPASDGTPFPVVLSFTVSTVETFTPNQLASFDLRAYRDGNMPLAYGGINPGLTFSPDSISTQTLASGATLTNFANSSTGFSENTPTVVSDLQKANAQPVISNVRPAKNLTNGRTETPAVSKGRGGQYGKPSGGG